jgi:hypothetical protein
MALTVPKGTLLEWKSGENQESEARGSEIRGQKSEVKTATQQSRDRQGAVRVRRQKINEAEGRRWKQTPQERMEKREMFGKIVITP